MKQAYQDFNFRSETLGLIHAVNRIIAKFSAAGYMLSVRQIYYQLVATDVIPNTERSYKKIAGIINDGRLAGMIDWDAIEDRNREIDTRPPLAQRLACTGISDQPVPHGYVVQPTGASILDHRKSCAGRRRRNDLPSERHPYVVSPRLPFCVHRARTGPTASLKSDQQ